MLRVPFDSHRLYKGTDPYYRLWLDTIAERVHAALREQNSGG